MSLTTTQGYRYRLVGGTLPNTVNIDTFQDEDIKVSNNITDLFDIGAVPGTFSKTITLPGTKKNNAFFEQYYDISVYNPDLFNTNQKVPAYLDFGGVFLVNGYLQLVKVNVYENKFVDSYEVNLFGAISNFSVDTTKLFLSDLSSLSTYNHTSSLNNITASWKGQLFNGDIVYPMADYGQGIQFSTQIDTGIDDPLDAMLVHNYKPAIRMKKVWDAIFDKVGFSYTGSFFNQAWIDDVYLFLNTDKRYPLYNQYDLESFGQGKVTNITGSNAQVVMSATVETDLAFNTIVYDNNNLFVIGTPTTYDQQIKSRLEANLNLSFRVSGSGAGSGMPQFTLYYYTEAGSLIDSQQLTVINDYLTVVKNSRSNTSNELYALSQKVNIPTINPGRFKIKIAYTVSGTNNFTVTLNPLDAKELSSFEITDVRQLGDQLVLDVPLNMPYGVRGIRLIDFIRGIQKKFNLIIYEDKTSSNRFVVETFNTWYKEGVIQNFNKYINLDNKIEFLPANNLAVNVISFSDAQDNDYVSKVFQQINNRTFGQAFWQDTGSYFSQGQFKVETTFGSGPIAQLGLTGYSGSTATSTGCSTYNVINYDPDNYLYVEWTDCDTGVLQSQYLYGQYSNVSFCSRTYPTTSNTTLYVINFEGDCSPLPDTQPSGSFLPVSIPIYIGSPSYTPTRVLPRMMFFNGMISSSQYYIEACPSSGSAATASAFSIYPYFDNYNVVTGSFPTTGSRSLLFNNEESSRLGSIPTNNLVNEYWGTYLGLLYNPRTRLVNASGVIPLADYFEIELNDLVQFRGNYYHLRAINDYNLTTGECAIELLGPVIADAVSYQLEPPNLTGSFNCDYNPDFDNLPCQPSPSPTPSISSTPGLSPSPTPSVSMTPSATPNLSPTPSASPTPTPSPTPSVYCASCRNWQYNLVPVGGDVIHYYSCADGSNQSISVSEGDTGTLCNCNTTGNPYTDNGSQLTEIGSC